MKLGSRQLSKLAPIRIASQAVDFRLCELALAERQTDRGRPVQQHPLQGTPGRIVGLIVGMMTKVTQQGSISLHAERGTKMSCGTYLTCLAVSHEPPRRGRRILVR